METIVAAVDDVNFTIPIEFDKTDVRYEEFNPLGEIKVTHENDPAKEIISQYKKDLLTAAAFLGLKKLPKQPKKKVCVKKPFMPHLASEHERTKEEHELRVLELMTKVNLKVKSPGEGNNDALSFAEKQKAECDYNSLSTVEEIMYNFIVNLTYKEVKSEESD